MTATVPHSEPILDVRGLRKIYQGGTRSVEAIRDLTFALRPGELVCIVGPSGAGKTTLLKCIAGLLDVTEGQVAAWRAGSARRPLRGVPRSGGGRAAGTCSWPCLRSAGCAAPRWPTSPRNLGVDEFAREKIFITHSSEADLCILFARTDERITAFLVDRDMGWTSSPIPLMGDWSAASPSLEGVRVPNANVLGAVGGGLELALSWIGEKRYVNPARAVGAAERLLGIAVEHARTRESMGRPIADYQAIQWQIADRDRDWPSSMAMPAP